MQNNREPDESPSAPTARHDATYGSIVSELIGLCDATDGSIVIALIIPSAMAWARWPPLSRPRIERRIHSSTRVIVTAAGFVMTPAREFREARDWLARHKRDPFLSLIILMTLTMATLHFGSNVILWRAFSPSDATRAIAQSQLLPRVNTITGRTRIFCKLPRGTYLFGYDLLVLPGEGRPETVGRICRDVVNGEWIWTFDNPNFKYLE